MQMHETAFASIKTADLKRKEGFEQWSHPCRGCEIEVCAKSPGVSSTEEEQDACIHGRPIDDLFR